MSEASKTAEVMHPSLREKGRLMSASEIERTLVRLAHQIVEKTNASEGLALVGIKRRGVPLAERLGALISGIVKRPVQTGVLDIQFYRDDLSTHGVRPVVSDGDLGFDVNGRDVILCDDVLYTGRTIRAALDALFAHGRPQRVQLAVLIDRGHRELPIEATYIGKHSAKIRWKRATRLAKRKIALLFYESSTRTRTSFELAAKGWARTRRWFRAFLRALKRARR
jgi:pyrimidine operon attenuation protein/uracil phosphoribosyltransferase